jgi:hypothetical protein
MAQIKLYATIGDEVREFTQAEYAQHELDQAAVKKAAAAQAKAEQALADKRQIILDRLGLTADEFKTLLG